MRTVPFCLLILLLIPLSPMGIASAQSSLTDGSGSISINDDAYNAYGEDFNGVAPLGTGGSYLLFQKQIGSGVGYDDGYSTIGGFVPFFEFSDQSIVFGTARLFITDDDELAGVNAGVGVRHYLDDSNQLIGASVFFDSDETAARNRYEQMTFGVEWIAPNFEIRSNLYVPSSDESNQTGVLFTGTMPFFEGKQILFEDTGLFETPMKGVDLEYGMPLFGYQWARGYVGTYYYNSPTEDDPVGFRGRMYFNFTNDIATEVAVSEDSMFGTRITVGVQITFSGRPMFKPFPQRTVLDKRYDQVIRNYRVAMGASQKPVNTPAINPLTNLPYVVTHVDDSFAGPGTGTFEDRFTTLQSDLSDIMLVWRGNTTPATPLIGGVTLVNNQRLLGEGVPHTFVAKDRGTFAFPGFDDAAPKPFVTEGAVGPVITLADNNEVSGLNIIDTTLGHDAIHGNGIRDFNINNVDVTGNGAAFNLINAFGNGRIVDSSFALGAGVGSAGINVANTGTPTLDLVIDNISTATGGLNALRLSANAARINATVDGMLADGNRNGVSLSASAGGRIDVDIADSTFTNATGVLLTEGRGLLAQMVAGNINMTIDNTPFTGASSHGMDVSGTAGALFNATITDSSFSDAMGHGVVMNFSNSPGANILTMVDTTVDNAGLDGMNLTSQNNSLLTVDITNGSFLNAGGDAFDTTTINNSTLNLFVDPTPATGATDNGFLFVVANDSTLNASFLDSDLGNAGLSAISGTVTNDSVANVSFTNGSLAINGINAINIFGDDSDINLTIDNADAQNNGSHGGQFTLQNDGDLIANISDSNFSNNPGDAFFASVTGNGSSAVFTLDTVLADVSGDSGFDFSATNNSVFSLTATNSSFDQSGSHGITGTVNNADATVALVGTSVEQSTLNGIDLIGTNGADITATFDAGTTIGDNLANGVFLSLDDSDADVAFNATTVDGNSGDGFQFLTVNGSTLDVSGTGASFTDNGADGIQGTVEDAGSVVTMNMTNVSANDQSAGLGMNLSVTDNALLTGKFTGSQFNNNALGGVSLIVDNSGDADLELTTSDVSNNGSFGIFSTVSNNSDMRIDLLNTTVTSNGGDGLFTTVDNSDAEVVIDGNTMINDNFGDGYSFQVVNGGTLTTTAPNDFIGRQISNNFFSGINGVVAGPGSFAQLIMQRTRIIDNAFGDGMTFNVTGGGDLDVQIRDFRIADHEFGNGITTTVNGAGSFASFDVLTSQIVNNGDFFGDNGFLLDLSGGADAVAEFRFTNFQGNGDHGILVSATDPGTTLAISTDADTTVSNHVLDGIQLNVANNAVVTSAEFAGLSSSNGGNGLQVNVMTNGSIQDLTLTDTSEFSNNIGNGFELNLNNGNITNLALLGMTSENQNSGMSIELLNGSSITDLTSLGVADGNFNDGMNLLVDDSTITNANISGSYSGNFDNGVIVDLTGTGTIGNFLVSGASFISNGDSGLEINVLDDAVIDPTIGNSTFSGNDDGFLLTVDQAAPVNPVSVAIGIGNQFIGNGNGVFLHGLSDAVILASVISNRFEGNTGSGLYALTEDSADFGQVGNAATFDLNQFVGNGNGLFFEARDTSNHDVLLPVNLDTRQSFATNDFGIRILTSSVVGISHRTYDIDSIDITNSDQDGIDIDISGQLDDTTTVNIGVNDFITSNANTGDGISTRTAGGSNNITILNAEADSNVQDGFRYLHEGGTTSYTLSASVGTNNGGRGASVDVRAAGSASLIQGNDLSDNNTQGLLLATLANSYPADPIAFDGDPDNPQDHFNNFSTDLFSTLMIAESNTITGNLNNGLVLSVGSSTRMNAVVNNNTFSDQTFIDQVDPENNTYDIRIFPVRSVNPTNSINVDSPALDTVFRDPVAHLDLIFGASGNPVNAKFGNTGEQIDVLSEGTSISTTITQSGRFTNPDPLKATHPDPVTGVDLDRPVRGYFQVHGHNGNPALDLLDGTNVDGGNFFILNGTQQSMFNTFSGANFLFPPLGTLFPDAGYP